MALVRKTVVKRSPRSIAKRKLRKGLTLTGGFYFPAWDDRCRRFIFREEMKFNWAQAYVQKQRVVVQAGGNVGVWPCWLGDRYERVYTFEPDADNWEALYRNIRNRKNIVAYHAALGARGGRTVGNQKCFYKGEGNCGGNYTIPDGDIPQMAIDELNLLVCDYIQLDIEGYELEALRGARNTIMRCRPIIQIEEKGHSKRYGYERGTAGKYLAGLGMVQLGRVEADIYFGWPKESSREDAMLEALQRG